MSYFFYKPKVSKFNSCLFLDQDILWLDISMEEPMTMNVVESSGYLLDYVSNLFVTERVVVQFAHLHHSVKVHIKKFKKHIEMILVAQNLDASYDIGVLKANHCLYLSIAHSLLPRCELTLESFKCICGLSLFVLDLIHDSKAPFSESLENFEAVYQNSTSR